MTSNIIKILDNMQGPHMI